MFMSMVFLMAGGGGAEGGAQGGGGLMGFLPILLIFAVIYFLMLRPQMKRQKEQRKMLDNLRQGDEVVTIGGLHGTIAGIREKDNSLILKVNENNKLIIDRAAVARVGSKADGSDIKQN